LACKVIRKQYGFGQLRGRKKLLFSRELGGFNMLGKLVLCGFVFFGLVLSAAAGASSQKPKPVVSEDYFVNAHDPGIQIFVRNKHPKGVKEFTSDRIVLFVHGSSFPAETSFDLPLDGLSWMDYIAQRGFDVYMLDVRGYGRSTRPPEMSQPAEKNPPIVRTETAVKDVAAMVDSILARRKVSKINLIGWSWGTRIMGSYTRACHQIGYMRG
jgi:pimeloyl-ACP methyl ester carboxylesterase